MVGALPSMVTKCYIFEVLYRKGRVDTEVPSALQVKNHTLPKQLVRLELDDLQGSY